MSVLGIQHVARGAHLVARASLDDIHMAHLPDLGACACAAVSGAPHFRRMLGVGAGEHILLANHLVVVPLGLRVEARILIGIPRLRAGAGAHDRFVKPANSTRAGEPFPGIVATFWIGIAVANETEAAILRGRQQGKQAEQPKASGCLEIGIGRHRIYFGASDQVVAGVVTDLSVRDLHGLRLARGFVFAVTVEKTKIVIVRLDRTEHVVQMILTATWGSFESMSGKGCPAT